MRSERIHRDWDWRCDISPESKRGTEAPKPQGLGGQRKKKAGVQKFETKITHLRTKPFILWHAHNVVIFLRRNDMQFKLLTDWNFCGVHYLLFVVVLRDELDNRELDATFDPSVDDDVPGSPPASVFSD
jgi:hypothetical protein